MITNWKMLLQSMKLIDVNNDIQNIPDISSIVCSICLSKPNGIIIRVPVFRDSDVFIGDMGDESLQEKFKETNQTPKLYIDASKSDLHHDLLEIFIKVSTKAISLQSFSNYLRYWSVDN